ncbi:MAG: hypothetical protein GXY76_19940 [Chloroflexi bacterium]|nr:hypothetical protein [Chloroflexota bacterium]
MGHHEHDIPLDPSSVKFVRAMEVLTIIGMTIVIGAGLAYFAGWGQCTPFETVVANWHLPVAEYWEMTRGAESQGYGWIIHNLRCAARVVLVGMAVLMTAPLVAVLAMLPTKGIYRWFYIVLALELIAASLMPLLE